MGGPVSHKTLCKRTMWDPLRVMVSYTEQASLLVKSVKTIEPCRFSWPSSYQANREKPVSPGVLDSPAGTPAHV